jgi:hypothetical protein
VLHEIHMTLRQPDVDEGEVGTAPAALPTVTLVGMVDGDVWLSSSGHRP